MENTEKERERVVASRRLNMNNKISENLQEEEEREKEYFIIQIKNEPLFEKILLIPKK
jgi:hypothetical protein